MKNALKVMTALAVALTVSSSTLGQRPRTAREEQKPRPAETTPRPSAHTPQAVKAKYMGGIFGYNKQYDGTLSFDDANRRLLFHDKTRRELFSIPYDSVAAAFSDTRSRRGIGGTTGTVVGAVGGIYSLPTLLIKRKSLYLTLQYRDPDTQAEGVTSFKIGNKGTLDSMLSALAAKAGLMRRGEVFVRRKDSATDTQTNTPD